MIWALSKHLTVRVNEGKVNMKELNFLSAEEEDLAKIAQANTQSWMKKETGSR
jgi:hypothetical protein